MRLRLCALAAMAEFILAIQHLRFSAENEPRFSKSSNRRARSSGRRSSGSVYSLVHGLVPLFVRVVLS